jgi:ATP-dependent helicase HepA
VNEVLDDPVKYDDYYSTRMTTVLNAIYEELYDQKVVLFTNYKGTFEAYRKALGKLFSEDEVSCFGEGMNKDEIELNAYRFQNDRTCRLMLCDYTGGEGRNFQCADYILHIDLPWDANMIEQRIGRLDRLERDPARPVVHSVVVYARDTFEEALYKFWNEGLRIFTHSLSGMEIIMNDINREIVTAIQQDFKFGLFEKIPSIIELAEKMREIVKKEQNFDAAGFIFRPMYNELKRLVDYYAQNENELFASTMTNWASLAGFHGTTNKKGVITYSAHSFVPKSAINALLIPPKWKDYINSAQNTFTNRVQGNYNRTKSIKNVAGSIRGTFIRKQAIENDYLHFFAPGDEVFDSIVNNALRSDKGQCTAMMFEGDFSWEGFVFTLTLEPNTQMLLENNVPITAIGRFKSYITMDQIVVPVPFDSFSDIPPERVVAQMERLSNLSLSKQRGAVVHLGRRNAERDFLNIKDRYHCSNLEWFISKFPDEKWEEYVAIARKRAIAVAKDKFRKSSSFKSAKREVDRMMNASIAKTRYFGSKPEELDRIRDQYMLIIKALQSSRIEVESAAFIWMVNANDR